MAKPVKTASAKAPKTEVAAIDALIKSMTTRGKTLREDAQKCLIMIMDNYVRMIDHPDGTQRPNGDISRLIQFQSVVRDNHGNSGLKALNTWIALSIPSLVWDNDNAKFNHKTGMTPAYAEIIEFKMEKQTITGTPREVHFLTMEPKVDPKPFIILDAYNSLLKRAEAAYEKTLKDTGVADLTLKAQIEALKTIRLDAIRAEETPAPKAPVVKEEAPAIMEQVA